MELKINNKIVATKFNTEINLNEDLTHFEKSV